MALVACPTASIGTASRPNAREAAAAFPTPVFDNVFFCGYTSEASFGAWSYLIVRAPEDGGNILVDSPRFAAPLVRRIEQMGGVALMFLSHRDDIADHAKFAAHFGCPRVMHEADGAARLGIEQVTTGEAPVLSATDCSPFRRPVTPAVIRCCCIAVRCSSPAITWRGRRRARRSSRFATPAGIRGPFRRGRWSGCSTIASNGCCPDTAAFTTRPRTRCTRISRLRRVDADTTLATKTQT